MKDNGRTRMESYNGVLYCDAYMIGEYTVADIEDMIDEIKINYNGRADIILKKSGSYSITMDAQMMLFKQVKEFRNFVYVAETENKKEISEYAAETYMASYNTKVAATK